MATYEQAIQESLDYFNGDTLAADVFVNKYAVRDNEGNFVETNPSQMHRRMAKEFARIEKNYKLKEEDRYKLSKYGQKRKELTEDKIYGLFDKFRYVVPQGSPMAVLGNNYVSGSLSNCVVISPPEDAYYGIAFVDQQLMHLFRRRAGVGFDISTLRPKNMPVANVAKTSTGAVSFMERFSFTTREVAQGGRRGALLLSIDIKHPEAEQFALIKQDLNKVTGANISLRISDEFMKAVEEDSDFVQQWPIDSDKPRVINKVKAKKLWDTIIKCAWNTAEPGTLFWDRHHWYSPSSVYPKFKNSSTNPCQPGFAKLLGKKGIKELSDVLEGDLVWSSEGWTKVTKKWSTGIKPVYLYNTTAGRFVGTENHKLISNGQKIEARSCNEIDILEGYSDFDVSINYQDVMDGLVIGDGSVHLSSLYKVYLTIGQDDYDYFYDNYLKEFIIGPHAVKYGSAYKIKTSISPEELPHLPDRIIPDRFYYGDFNKICGFLRGLYSANGSIVANRVSLKSSSFGLIKQVQTMLSAIGIRSYYTTNKPTKTIWHNGIYTSKESYDLQISTDIDIFMVKIGFIQNYKNKKLEEILKNANLQKNKIKTYDIISTEYLGDFEVFDITVDNKSHTYWTEGINVSNCGELPQGENDSCRLIAINLFGFVKSPFKIDAEFDYVNFYSVVYESQRLMDNLVDLELESIERILDKIDKDPEPEYMKETDRRTWKLLYETGKSGRRTGLGFTALADTIAALKMKYDSIEAQNFVRDMMSLKCEAEWDSSVDMAVERGSFEGFEPNIENTSHFIQMIRKEYPQLYSRMMRYGRRNISISTVAPTGSVSILTQTSSGIEPVYALSYKRRRKINPSDKNIKIDFIDQKGDAWQEYIVYHPKLKMWMDITDKKDIIDSPYYKSTALDIDWEKRLIIESLIQDKTSHAISGTINLPRETTVEQVGDIYMKSYKLGLKGITIYRDGSRDGVLIGNNIEENILLDNNAPKRPKTLDADVNRFINNREKWVAFVGLLSGRPYEIFTGRQEQFPIPSYVEHGKIRKNNSIRGYGRYEFIYINKEGEDIIVKGLGVAFDKEYYNYGKLVSAALRHGQPLPYVAENVQSLEFTNGESPLSSWQNGIARTLKKYIKEGTEVPKNKSCDDCGGNLIFQEGCMKCVSCGNNKCD